MHQNEEKGNSRHDREVGFRIKRVPAPPGVGYSTRHSDTFSKAKLSSLVNLDNLVFDVASFRLACEKDAAAVSFFSPAVARAGNFYLSRALLEQCEVAVTVAL